MRSRPEVARAVLAVTSFARSARPRSPVLTGEIFGPLGITNIRTFVDPQNPTRAAVLMDVPDMDAFQAAMQTQAAADAMSHDGVLPETLVILLES